jgi:hypothetical protein
MNVDPIVSLESLGYTEREASFLYLVAVHSGYFLRRQFDYFIDRQKGAIAQHFLTKARIAGHIEVIDYGQGRHVYHLYAKPIYRLLRNPESQHRRRKGDGSIRARLITLDYILENSTERFLESDEEKVEFFAHARKLPLELFTDDRGKLQPLLAAFPISIAERAHPSSSPVRFLFPDEALLTTEKFSRFLSVIDRLLCALGSFEVIFASSSAHNFPVAEELFRKQFAPPDAATQATFEQDWRENRRVTIERRPPASARFTTILLRYNYPQLRRNESRSLSRVRGSGLSDRPQATDHQGHSVQGGSNAG